MHVSLIINVYIVFVASAYIIFIYFTSERDNIIATAKVITKIVILHRIASQGKL